MQESSRLYVGMPDDLIELYLKLNQMPYFGPAKFQQLLSFCCDELTNVSQCSKSDFVKLGWTQEQINAFKKPDERYLTKGLGWLDQSENHFLLGYTFNNFPKQLRQISTPPMLLFGYGEQTLLGQPQIAMVGSRNPSVSGKQVAYSLAKELSEIGWVVTSGMAMGIDAACHRGALDAEGASIGVLGAGIDQIYPKRNREIYARMKEGNSCIVSEFSPGIMPKPENFPRRNRIVSGFCYGVVVVEAEIKSGSLISARYALEQDREVFAVPGNINNPLSRGCHHLIKQGAKLVESVVDIHEEFEHLLLFPINNGTKKLKKISNQGLAGDRLLDSVDYEATALDVIALRSGMPIAQLLSALLEYELKGLVASVAGGYIKLGAK
jgi:DNA processing protein